MVKKPEKSQKYSRDDVGQKVIGKVEKIDAAVGLRVRLATGQVGMVLLTEISNDFKSNPTSKFTVKQEVECTIVKVDAKRFVLPASILRRVLCDLIFLLF